MTELPDGLREKDGLLVFECRVCGNETEWPCEPEDFDITDSANVCGRNPWCCP